MLCAVVRPRLLSNAHTQFRDLVSGPARPLERHRMAKQTPSDPLTPIEQARATGTPEVSSSWWAKYTRWRQTSSGEAVLAENKLLALVKTPLQVEDVAVGPRKEEYLHTISGGRADGPPLVLVPGYGAGSGFWFRNVTTLARSFRLFAVDWLGTGLSGRPRFTAQNRLEAEAFFVNSLANWRQATGVEEPMVLVGHSLGGYLAATYALQHPEHVSHLVLVCPAGIPKQPDQWEQRFVTSSQWSLRAQLFNLARWAWTSGVTPGSLIRALGPWGPGLIHGYVSRRFATHGAQLSDAEVDAFKDYFYHIAAAPGSGEYALRHLLAPGAWAHSPLEERLHELKVPVTFIYGAQDWMNPEHGVRLCEWLRTHRPLAAPSDLRVDIIPNAGHFVFIDDPAAFDRSLAAAVQHVLPPHIAAEATAGAPAAPGGGAPQAAQEAAGAAADQLPTPGGTT